MKSIVPATVRPATRFDSPEQEAYLNLWRTHDRLRALEDALFARFELTCQQYNVLRLLKAHGTLPTLTLANSLVSRAPDITRMVDRLAARGLISRDRPADNRRVVNVTITLAGLDLVRDIAEPLAKCHHQQLGHLPADDLRQLTVLLRVARRPHEDESSSWH